MQVDQRLIEQTKTKPAVPNRRRNSLTCLVCFVLHVYVRVLACRAF